MEAQRGPLVVSLVPAQLLLVKGRPKDRQTSCASCGSRQAELFLHPPSRVLEGLEGDAVQALCATCFGTIGKDESRIVITRRYAGRPSEDPNERFSELFKAARILLREKVSDEDKILPTLNLAHQRGLHAPRILFNSVRVVNVVDGVPILERFPLSFSCTRSLYPPHTLYSINGSMFPYKRAVKADEIARVYQKVLENEGLSWGGESTRITYEFMDWYLWLSVERGSFIGGSTQAEWPPPRFVGKVAHAALQEFSKHLIIRQRGGQKNPDNLIPAIVAYLLRNSLPVGTEVEGRKEIHQLLNRHVLCDVPWKRLPEDGYANTGEVVQLWENAKWIENMATRIRDPGPHEIK
jgi:hypothetical protein